MQKTCYIDWIYELRSSVFHSQQEKAEPNIHSWISSKYLWNSLQDWIYSMMDTYDTSSTFVHYRSNRTIFVRITSACTSVFQHTRLQVMQILISLKSKKYSPCHYAFTPIELRILVNSTPDLFWKLLDPHLPYFEMRRNAGMIFL